jgi:hypothetical protein
MDNIAMQPFIQLIQYLELEFPMILVLINEGNSSTSVSDIATAFSPIASDQITFRNDYLKLHFKDGKSINKTNGKLLNQFRDSTIDLPASRSGRNTQIAGQYGNTTIIVKAYNTFIQSLQIKNEDNIKEYFIFSINEIKPKIREVWNYYQQLMIPVNQEQEQEQKAGAKITRTSNSIQLDSPYSSRPSIPSQSIPRQSQSIPRPAASNITFIRNNRQVIYTEVKQIILRLFERCNNYMLDMCSNVDDNVLYSLISSSSPNYIQYLHEFSNRIDDKYDIIKFRYDLLTSVDGDELLFSLSELASGYMEADIMNAKDITLENQNTPLTLFRMVEILNLTEVKWLAIMLSSPEMVPPQFPSFPNFIAILPSQINLLNTTDNFTKLFPLFCFSILYNIYYGEITYNNKNGTFIKYTKQFINLLDSNKILDIRDNGLMDIPNEVFLKGIVQGSVSNTSSSMSNNSSSNNSSSSNLAAVNSLNLPNLLLAVGLLMQINSGNNSLPPGMQPGNQMRNYFLRSMRGGKIIKTRKIKRNREAKTKTYKRIQMQSNINAKTKTKKYFKNKNKNKTQKV